MNQADLEFVRAEWKRIVPGSIAEHLITIAVEQSARANKSAHDWQHEKDARYHRNQPRGIYCDGCHSINDWVAEEWRKVEGK